MSSLRQQLLGSGRSEECQNTLCSGHFSRPRSGREEGPFASSGSAAGGVPPGGGEEGAMQMPLGPSRRPPEDLSK